MSKVRVQFLNPDPECVLATESTLKQLPGAAFLGFERDASGAIVVADGWSNGEAGNPGFLKFAAERQGYVKHVAEAL